MGAGDPLERIEECRGWLDEAHVAGDGLDDDGSGIGRVGGEPRIEGGRVVVRQDRREPRDRAGDTGGVTQSKGRDATAGLHQQAIAVAVVAAIELEHDVATSRCPREADGRHGRLGAGVDEADALEAGGLRDAAAELDLAGGECSKGGAFPRSLADRLNNRRGGMAENERPEGGNKIDIAAAFRIEHERTLAAGNRDGISANGAERADRTVHATREETRSRIAEAGVIHHWCSFRAQATWPPGTPREGRCRAHRKRRRGPWRRTAPRRAAHSPRARPPGTGT